MVLGVTTRLEKGFRPLSKRGPWAFRTGERQFATSTSHVAEVDEQEAEMEANRLGMRETTHERAELGERERRPVLVVEAHGRGGERFGVVRR
jgi:hypothetical protein